METTTPLMKQYHAIKQGYSDTLVLFQVGDFYELFYDDAKKASAFLGIALTKRGKNNGEPIPLCGVPVHALEHYLNKLIRGGFKVALCDQLHEAQPGKMVERGITRIFTPGTLTDSALLDEKKNSYICSFFPLQQSWGLLFGELLTAQLYATTIPATHEKVIEAELVRFFPDEILLPAKTAAFFQSYFKERGYFVSLVDGAEQDEQQSGISSWLQQFKPEVQQQIVQHQALYRAIQTFYIYMHATHEASLSHFNTMHWYKPDDYLILDAATQKNLELVHNNQDGGRTGTLFSVLDGATTPMGSRMIKKWLLRPLIKQESIEDRYDAIDAIKSDIVFMQQLHGALAMLGDSERVIGRIALRRAVPADYLMLMNTLSQLPSIKKLIEQKMAVPLLRTIQEFLIDFSSLHDLLERALNADAAKEWIIKKGFNARLDGIRELIETGNQKILELEQQEQQATGINSLKIRYNQVHGYSIEITKTHYDAIPAHYVRRQTLVGRERFTTPQLQQLEYEIARARTEIVTVEQEVFESIKQVVAQHITALRKVAHACAHIDALLGFALIAQDYRYVRPRLSTKRDIIIKQGRHPVVERLMNHHFIPNDTQLTDEQSLWIITGPNMGGKSTYLRQVALLSLMAQCGSFIPVQEADLPILDRIFTRIGSGDNLVGGKSTFMVEMEETAAICSQATEKSLVILDEVGRGTSTFDGLAIAQAVVEYLYGVVKSRCLFATHYHELTQLEQQFPGIASYYAASRKTEQGIVFLYRILRGVADGSFGIEVAKLAQLPPAIIQRSQLILAKLSSEPEFAQQSLPLQGSPAHNAELMQRVTLLESKLKQTELMIKKLRELDYDSLSPKQAFDLLWRLKEEGI